MCLRDYVPPSRLQQTPLLYPRRRQARLTTSLTDIIDGKSQEIRPHDGEVFSKMEDLADELPESSPRFILLSHPLTLVSGACQSGLNCANRTDAVMSLLVLRSSIRPLRPPLLPPRELQPITTDDVCRCSGIDAQYGGGQPGH